MPLAHVRVADCRSLCNAKQQSSILNGFHPVSDPDPDPTFQVIPNRDPDPTLTLGQEKITNYKTSCRFYQIFLEITNVVYNDVIKILYKIHR